MPLPATTHVYILMRKTWPDPFSRMDHQEQRTPQRGVLHATFVSSTCNGVLFEMMFGKKVSERPAPTEAPMAGVLLF